jgi:predicted XRE-type DNA-binding protein
VPSPKNAAPVKATRARAGATAFDVLGFGAEEAEHLRIRAELMLALAQRIERAGWTQAAAAEALGVTQPRISDLLRGKIDRFSIDTLVDLLTAAGAAVTVTVRARRAAA